MSKEYKHFISLGCFCGVAMELERLGLRDASYPFDWLISEYSGVCALIKNNFEDFLNYDFLSQFKNNRNRYYNEKYKISFFHDFSQYISLEEQLDSVKSKYYRRILRFYNAVSEPTLFIRYVNQPCEAEFWIDNYESQLKMLKSFCEENELILIASTKTKLEENEYTFCVENDENSTVSQEFCSKNKRLADLLCSEEIYDQQKRSENLKIFEAKQKKKQEKENKIINKIKRKIKTNKKPYIHNKVKQ